MTIMMRLLVGRPAFQNAGCQLFKCSRRAISSANLTIESTQDPSGFENRPANKDLTFGTVSYACQRRLSCTVVDTPLMSCFDDFGPGDCQLMKSLQARLFRHYVECLLCSLLFLALLLTSLTLVVDIDRHFRITC
jgi:hypothetical protein